MSTDRSELRDAARKAFGAGGLAPDFDANWSTVAEMGALMMAVPESLGGLGLGCEAVGVIHTELGRTLAPGPAIAQMLSIEALGAAERHLADRQDLLDRAMAGEVMTASLAPAGSWGKLTAVPDADRASHVLVVQQDRIALAPLEGAALTPRETWDKTRRLFDVRPVREGMTLAEGEAATALAQRLEAQMLLALAGDSLGGADAILELTIAYLETRRQFDRPLALFQALKHRVADMKTWLSAAEALFWSRASDAEAGVAELGALKAHAAGVYRAIAEDAVQLHGGIGLTMEHPCHLFLKRATLNSALGGDADHWEEQAGRRALEQAVA
jgi:alkylation response protein AidB-like acyl-CoA dehydrogenase